MTSRSKELAKVASVQGKEIAYVREQGIESFREAMDSVKKYLERFDTSSPNLYVTRNKQILAACQMTSVMDYSSSLMQRVAYAACMVRVATTMNDGLESGLEKEEIKIKISKVIEETAGMFGLHKKSSKRK